MASRANSLDSTNSSVDDESVGVDDDEDDDANEGALEGADRDPSLRVSKLDDVEKDNGDDDGIDRVPKSSSPLRLSTCFIHRPLLQ